MHIASIGIDLVTNTFHLAAFTLAHRAFCAAAILFGGAAHLAARRRIGMRRSLFLAGGQVLSWLHLSGLLLCLQDAIYAVSCVPTSLLLIRYFPGCRNGPLLRGIFRCAVCDRLVSLQDCKINEDGRAVHESCYILRTLQQSRREPPRTYPLSETSASKSGIGEGSKPVGTKNNTERCLSTSKQQVGGSTGPNTSGESPQLVHAMQYKRTAITGPGESRRKILPRTSAIHRYLPRYLETVGAALSPYGPDGASSLSSAHSTRFGSIASTATSTKQVK